MTKISNRQLVIAFLVSRLSTEMIVTPGEMIKYGADRYWAIIAAKLVILALYLPVIFLTVRFKGDSAITACIRRNRIFGAAVGIVMAVSLTLVAAQTVMSIQHYVTDTLLNTIWSAAGIAVLIAASAYGAYKGLSAVTRSAVFASAVFALLILLIGVTMWDKADFTYIYPYFIEDGSFFVKCTLSEISSNSEILIFAVLCDKVRSKPHRTVLYYLPILLLLLELVNFIYNLILGPYLSNVEYPLYIISSLSDVVIFQRLDGIDAIVWLMCGLIKTALLIYCAADIFSKVSGSDKKNIFIVVYSLVLFGICLVISSNRAYYDYFTNLMNSGIAVFAAGFLLPTAALIFGKGVKRKKEEQNETV